MILTLPLPKASEWDPLVEGEGRLDPLGLSAIAGRLADTYASPVRARMRRVRFLTASCLGAIVAAPLEGFPVADGGDTAELAFERLLVEAFVRSGADVGTGVPGITKAAAAVRSRQRLDPRGYLKSPRVFGFHGVYRPLAFGLRLVDRAGGPLDRADELVAMWLTESAFPGLAEGSGEVQGQHLVDWLTDRTAAALDAGHNTFGVTSDYARLIARALLPGEAGSGERKLMRKWLTDPAVDPVMPEVIRRLHGMGRAAGEPEATLVARLAEEGSRALRVRMLAVVAFEEFARDLEWAFDSYRFASSAALGGVPSRPFDDLPGLTVAGLRLPGSYTRAVDALGEAADASGDLPLIYQFVERFALFAEPLGPDELVDTLMEHHGHIQNAKPPAGKRPWLENVGTGWAVRPLWAINEQPIRLEFYPRPYRFAALFSFLGDLYA